MGRLRIEFVVRRASQKGEKSQIMETMKIGVSPYAQSDPEGARRGSQSTGVDEDETAGQIAVLKQASMQKRKEDEVTGVGREIALRGGMYPDQGGKKGEVGGEIDPHAEDPSTGVIGNGESAPRAGGQS